MDENLIEETLTTKLQGICTDLTNALEARVGNISGVCYLLGHCLCEGFIKAGYNAKELSGNLVLQTLNSKYIVYGNLNIKGKSVGEYHTWCTVDLDEVILIDCSLKYNIVFLKENLGIKLNKRLPNSLITTEFKTWYYNYIEDSTLVPKSKFFLNQINKELLELLINTVYESVKSRLE